MSVKQIGTAKNFLYQLDKRFRAIEYNQLCNRIVIIGLVFWCIMLTFKLTNLQVQNEPTYNRVVPVINLEPIDIDN